MKPDSKPIGLLNIGIVIAAVLVGAGLLAATMTLLVQSIHH
jgi:hypothetical protein